MEYRKRIEKITIDHRVNEMHMTQEECDQLYMAFRNYLVDYLEDPVRVDQLVTKPTFQKDAVISISVNGYELGGKIVVDDGREDSQ